MPNSFERAFNPAFQGGTALASRLFEQDRAEKLRLSEQLRAEKLFDVRLADQRKYAVMQGLISEAERVGIPVNEIADMKQFGDTDAFASVLRERKGDFDAGSSPAPTAPTKQQSESSSFLYGQQLRGQKQAVEDLKAEKALGVAVDAENRTAEALRKQTESVRNYQVRQALTMRANQAGMDPTAVSDMEGIGDLDFYSARVMEAEQDYRAGSSFTDTTPTPEQQLSPSFQFGRQVKAENAARVVAQSKQNEAYENIKAHNENVRALQGKVGSIENLPQDLKERLFSPNGVVRDQAFYDISQNIHRRNVTIDGNPTTVQTYINLPKPNPTEPPPVKPPAGKPTSPLPVNPSAGKPPELPPVKPIAVEPPPPSPAKPVADEVAELDFWRKLPVYGYSKENDMLLKSDNPNIWRPALQHIKSNTTLRAGTYVGAKPTYHWTPGKSSFQSVPTNSLPMMPASIEPDDSDPR